MCRYLLGAVLLMAGAGKVGRLNEFVDRLTLRGVPYLVARGGGSFVAWLELTLGICLVLGVMRREAALLAVVLLLGVTAFGFLLGGEDCNCLVVPGLPGLGQASGWSLLGRNAVLLLLAVVLLVREGRRG